ncbi:MAG: heparan-alpha-glucosaminide N-acetyltransferase domain-containing protein, partial [Promethearchaeota archaeon]
MRLKTIDIMRGISIFFMLLAHAGETWMITSSRWINGWFFVVFNVVGGNTFIFSAGLGYGFSYRRYKRKNLDKNEIILKINSRTYAMFIIAFIFNIATVFIKHTGIEGLWTWNLFQTLAFVRFFEAFLIKLKRKYRFIIAFLIILPNSFLAMWTFYNQGTNSLADVITYVLYQPWIAYGLLFSLPFFIIGELMGESMEWIFTTYRRSLDKKSIMNTNTLRTNGSNLKEANSDIDNNNSNINDNNNNNTKSNSPNNQATSSSHDNHYDFDFNKVRTMKMVYQNIGLWVLSGFILILIGIVLGWQLTMHDYGWNVVEDLNRHPQWELSGLPYFLVTYTWQWSFYAIGINLVIGGVLLLFADILRKKERLEKIGLYGRYSLTIYFT